MDKDEFVKKQIRNLNRHLPKGRLTLKELLNEDKPQLENKDGSTHRFKKEELKYLSKILPKEEHSQLRLPIIIRISPQLGRGVAKVSGKAEREVLWNILEKEEKEDEEELLIYRPEIRIIRKKLPTTTQYAFMISSGRKNRVGRT